MKSATCYSKNMNMRLINWYLQVENVTLYDYIFGVLLSWVEDFHLVVLVFIYSEYLICSLPLITVPGYQDIFKFSIYIDNCVFLSYILTYRLIMWINTAYKRCGFSYISSWVEQIFNLLKTFVLIIWTSIQHFMGFYPSTDDESRFNIFAIYH